MTIRKMTNFNLYEEVRNQIKTGDVIAFSGHGHVSALIKLLTGCPYSHVGIVFDVRGHAGLEKAVILMESTVQTTLEDDGMHKVKEGVQMHFLSKRLADYPGKAWWVPLKEPLTAEQTDKLQSWAREAYEEFTPFNWNGLYGLGFELLTGLGLFTHSDFNALFCSQFVTRALKETGIAPEQVIPARQTPRSVIESPCFLPPVPLKPA